MLIVRKAHQLVLLLLLLTDSVEMQVNRKLADSVEMQVNRKKKQRLQVSEMSSRTRRATAKKLCNKVPPRHRQPWQQQLSVKSLQGVHLRLCHKSKSKPKRTCEAQGHRWYLQMHLHLHQHLHLLSQLHQALSVRTCLP